MKAVDTTGAGDIFRAAFIYSLLKNDSPRDMLRFANAAAAVSCTRAGAMAGVPSLDEVNRLTQRWISASVSTRPIASGSVTPVSRASVGARSIGAAGSRYSPFLIPNPNRITGTRVS